MPSPPVLRPCAVPGHDGRHLDVGGQCVHAGAVYAFRPGVCSVDGCLASVVGRLDLRTGERVLLEAGSDQPHVHPPAVDASALAAGISQGIVDGFRAARAEQRRGR